MSGRSWVALAGMLLAGLSSGAFVTDHFAEAYVLLFVSGVMYAFLRWGK